MLGAVYFNIELVSRAGRPVFSLCLSFSAAAILSLFSLHAAASEEICAYLLITPR